MPPIRRKRPSRTATNAPRTVNGRILTIRGVSVILDNDLAELYGVSTKALNQAVARNRARFPADFAFTLTAREIANLRSQSVTSSLHGGRRYSPRAFTEHGIAMLSSVLKSRRAVAANVAIMRAFIQLRAAALSHIELTRKLSELEQKYDGKFTVVFGAIRRLMAPPVEVEAPRRRIGFVVGRLAAPP